MHVSSSVNRISCGEVQQSSHRHLASPAFQGSRLGARLRLAIDLRPEERPGKAPKGLKSCLTMAFALMDVKTFTLLLLASGIMPAPCARDLHVALKNG